MIFIARIRAGGVLGMPLVRKQELTKHRTELKDIYLQLLRWEEHEERKFIQDLKSILSYYEIYDRIDFDVLLRSFKKEFYKYCLREYSFVFSKKLEDVYSEPDKQSELIKEILLSSFGENTKIHMLEELLQGITFDDALHLYVAICYYTNKNKLFYSTDKLRFDLSRTSGVNPHLTKEKLIIMSADVYFVLFCDFEKEEEETLDDLDYNALWNILLSNTGEVGIFLLESMRRMAEDCILDCRIDEDECLQRVFEKLPLNLMNIVKTEHGYESLLVDHDFDDWQDWYVSCETEEETQYKECCGNCSSNKHEHSDCCCTSYSNEDWLEDRQSSGFEYEEDEEWDTEEDDLDFLYEGDEEEDSEEDDLDFLLEDELAFEEEEDLLCEGDDSFKVKGVDEFDEKQKEEDFDSLDDLGIDEEPIF